jgi:leucyl-tRNA synthetase
VSDSVVLPVGASEKQAQTAALASAKVAKYLKGKEVKKVIYVKDKLINIVI